MATILTENEILKWPQEEMHGLLYARRAIPLLTESSKKLLYNPFMYITVITSKACYREIFFET